MAAGPPNGRSPWASFPQQIAAIMSVAALLVGLIVWSVKVDGKACEAMELAKRNCTKIEELSRMEITIASQVQATQNLASSIDDLKRSIVRLESYLIKDAAHGGMDRQQVRQ